jgi:antitoxin component of MazEF toxin-antitoxin module
MIKTLTKHGNSYALIIDKPILELLRAGPDTPFEVVSDGKSLMITPVRDAQTDAKFEAALEDLENRFGNAMKRLAE